VPINLNTLTLHALISIHTDAPIFDNKKVKLIRHKDTRAEYRDIQKNRNALLEYQKEQAKEIYKGVDYIISFVGLEGSKAVFFGVFKVGDWIMKNGEYYYDLTEEYVFEDYKDRVVIYWGKAAISWHQWYYKQEKEVSEILPKGYMGDFKGLTDFVLTFDELQRLVNNPDANRDWKSHLSSVNGVYLILDTSTKDGRLYVGSAYGNEGIWQRWTEYAKNSHGHNKEMVALQSLDKEHAKHFRFSILQALPSNVTSKEIVAIENLYKEKLGSRAYGLNAN
jgi:hypothetical protein